MAPIGKILVILRIILTGNSQDISGGETPGKAVPGIL
jgi:hypothetical protein